MTLSNRFEMLLEAEYFFKSTKITSGVPHKLSIVVTGMDVREDQFLVENRIMEEEIKKRHPGLNDAQLLFCKIHYTQHPPVRWFVPPQGEVCIFVDADVLVCSEIKELNKKTNAISGVMAHRTPFKMSEWLEIFSSLNIPFSGETFRTSDTNEECPFYVNYGVVVVDSDIVQEIKSRLKHNIERVLQLPKTKGSFFTGQIALTVTIEETKIKKQPLPIRYNYPDYDFYDQRFPEELKNIKFYHYFSNKHHFPCLDRFLNKATPGQRAAIAPILGQRKKIII